MRRGQNRTPNAPWAAKFRPPVEGCSRDAHAMAAALRRGVVGGRLMARLALAARFAPPVLARLARLTARLTVRLAPVSVVLAAPEKNPATRSSSAEMRWAMVFVLVFLFLLAMGTSNVPLNNHALPD